MRRLYPLLFVSLLSACTHVMVPNARICSVSGVMAAGADCGYTLTDKIERIDLDALIKLLEPDLEASPPHAGALIISADDFRRYKTALDQACSKLKGCTHEVPEGAARIEAVLERAAMTTLARPSAATH